MEEVQEPHQGVPSKTLDFLWPCFDNRCFKEYWNDRKEGAETIEEVAAFCEHMMDSYFEEDEEWQEWYPEEYKLYLLIKEGKLEDLPELHASATACHRRLAKRKHEALEEGKDSKLCFIDLWNYAFCGNGESHGTVLAMCLKSDKPELHQLGHEILLDLKDLQGFGGIDFDT